MSIDGNKFKPIVSRIVSDEEFMPAPSFRVLPYRKGYSATRERTTFNTFLYLLSGELTVKACNVTVHYDTPAIISFSKNAKLELHSTGGGKIVVHRLTDEFTQKICNAFSVFSGTGKSIRMAGIPLKQQVRLFLDTVESYHKAGMDGSGLSVCKSDELLLLLKLYYPEEAVRGLLMPFENETSEFRYLVDTHFHTVKTVQEMASITGLSLTSFSNKFRAVYGTSPRTWELERRAERILADLRLGNAGIGEIIEKYGFNSHTHFTRFCRKYFGRTPSSIILENKK